MAANDETAGKDSGNDAVNENMFDDEFSLKTQKAPLDGATPKKVLPKKNSPANKKKGPSSEVLSYRYDDKRTNNPHVGMVDT